MRSRHYGGILLVSLGTLLLELTLTRVLSVSLWYHFGFLVISTALLGFGASGVLLSVWTGVRDRADLDRTLTLLCIAFGVVAILSFLAMQRIPFDPFKPLANWHQVALMPLYYVALAAPFFCSGLAIALLLTRGGAAVNRLYAFDLLGAGLGCAAIAFVMPRFGGSGSVVVAAMVGFLAAATIGFRTARRRALLAVGLAVACVPLALSADRLLPIAVAQHKQHPLLPAPPRPAPLYTEWNTFSRIDVYSLPAHPEQGWPTPGLGIVIDSGTAGTGMGDLSSGVDAILGGYSRYRPSGFAFVGKQHPKVLIIGSGAGRDVLESLYFGASEITAVEINPIINRIVTDKLRSYWGGLFQRPEVHLVTDEGRSFVRRSQDKYDIIISVQTVSNAAITSGALSLAEDYMFTCEAFEDFYDHLTDDGVLLITHPHLPRLFATVREVFRRRGLGSAAQHLCAFRTPILTFGARHSHPGILFKKSPFSEGEVMEIKRRLGVLDPRTVLHDDDLPAMFYSPYDAGSERLLVDVLTAPDVKAVYARSAYEIFPVTDDRPFFNQQRRWSDLDLTSWIAHDMTPGAESVLVILLLQSGLIAGVLIVLPLLRFARQGLQAKGHWRFLIYFAGLGLGFIMIEIALLQRFTLFLGQPVYTFAVILASLLVFTGAGSSLAGRFGEVTRRRLRQLVVVLLAVLLITNFVTARVFAAALGLPLLWRVVIAVLVIAPLGVLLGMPFPSGLRVVAGQAPALVPWAWGVNGFFTVIGSVGAMIIGMIMGFKVVVVVAACFYLAAFVAMITVQRD